MWKQGKVIKEELRNFAQARQGDIRKAQLELRFAKDTKCKKSPTCYGSS